MEEEVIRQEPSRARPRKKPIGFFAEHRDTLINGVIITVAASALLGLVGFVFVTYRDVGELRQAQNDMRDRITRSEQRADQQTGKDDSIIRSIQEKLNELRIFVYARLGRPNSKQKDP